MGGNTNLVDKYFKDTLDDVINEINTLYSLSKKDNRNIVTYYDHEIVKHENPLRYDLFLRMEYLKPLSSYMNESNMTLEDAINLSIDIATALNNCHNQDIIHSKFIPEKQRYNISLIHHFIRYKVRDMKVTINNKEYSDSYTTVCVCNGRYYGGGYKVGFRSSLTDNKFIIYSSYFNNLSLFSFGKIGQFRFPNPPFIFIRYPIRLQALT